MEHSHEHGEGKTCGCPHHKMVPYSAFAIGLLFFLHALGVLGSGLVDLVWPLLVMAAAGSKLGMCKCC